MTSANKQGKCGFNFSEYVHQWRSGSLFPVKLQKLIQPYKNKQFSRLLQLSHDIINTVLPPPPTSYILYSHEEMWMLMPFPFSLSLSPLKTTSCKNHWQRNIPIFSTNVHTQKHNPSTTLRHNCTHTHSRQWPPIFL